MKKIKREIRLGECEYCGKYVSFITSIIYNGGYYCQDCMSKEKREKIAKDNLKEILK